MAGWNILRWWLQSPSGPGGKTQPFSEQFMIEVWERGEDLNLQPSAYEADEPPLLHPAIRTAPVWAAGAVGTAG